MAKENLRSIKPLITCTFKKSEYDENPEYYGLGNDYKWNHDSDDTDTKPAMPTSMSDPEDQKPPTPPESSLFSETQVQQVV